jgi:D-3-phosphoglycerate dehydrogenase
MKNKLSINKRNQISVIEPMFSKNLILKEKILKHFKKVNFNYKKLNENQLINKINDAEGIILGLQPLTKKVIDKSKNLKIVAKFGVGIDNIDLNECKKKKILVRRAVGANAISVAEVVISNSINLIRNINQNYNKLKKGLWEKSIGPGI